MNKLIYFFKSLFRRKSLKVLDKAQEKLEIALMNRGYERIALKKDINAFVARCLKTNKGSSFIPSKRYSKIEVISLVNGKFGSRMKKIGVVIKQDLTLSDV